MPNATQVLQSLDGVLDLLDDWTLTRMRAGGNQCAAVICCACGRLGQRGVPTSGRLEAFVDAHAWPILDHPRSFWAVSVRDAPGKFSDGAFADAARKAKGSSAKVLRPAVAPGFAVRHFAGEAGHFQKSSFWDSDDSVSENLAISQRCFTGSNRSGQFPSPLRIFHDLCFWSPWRWCTAAMAGWTPMMPSHCQRC